jgi:hypothetical protein
MLTASDLQKTKQNFKPNINYFRTSDPDNLIVPYEESIDFMSIAVFQSQPTTIPCKPTNSKAKVSLWKVYTNSGRDKEIEVNSTIGIIYNSKKGFHFEYPRWDSETRFLECRIKLGDSHQMAQIEIDWPSKT